MTPTPPAPEPTSPSDPAADLLLIQEVLEGRTSAVEQLVDRLAVVPAMVRVRNQALGRPLSETEREDLVQDCLAIIWRKLSLFPGVAPLESWVYRICALEIMNAIRTRRRQPAILADAAQEVPSPHQDDPGPSDAEQLSHGLDRLGPPASDVIRLKHYERLTFEEIAGRIGTPLNTVKSQYYRGLERLRQMLAPRIHEGTP